MLSLGMLVVLAVLEWLVVYAAFKAYRTRAELQNEREKRNKQLDELEATIGDIKKNTIPVGHIQEIHLKLMEHWGITLDLLETVLPSV